VKCPWCLEDTPGYYFKCPKCGKFFEGFGYEKEYCPNCKEAVLRKVCGRCKNEIPPWKNDLVIGIALVGSKEVGKSHYFVSLFKSIREELSKRGFYIQFFRNKYWKSLENQLKHQKRVLPVTSASTSTFDRTLICKIAHRPSGKEFVVSIRDVAGEDIENIEDKAELDKKLSNISKADAILFLIDLFQVENFMRNENMQKVLKNLNTQLPSVISHPDVLFSKVINFLLRTHRKKSGSFLKKGINKIFGKFGKENSIEIPIAVALTKLDLLLVTFDKLGSGMLANSPLRLSETNHFKGNSIVCLSEISNVSRDIKTLLERVNLDNLINMIEDNFSSSCFFGISSLGAPPDKGGKIRDWRPMRVEEPFLWILHKLNIFEGSSEC
jgi:rRNA maturation endonuclease Nob1